MKTRVISAVVAIPLLLFSVIYGGTVLKLIGGLLSLIGMGELCVAVSKKLKSVHFVGFAAEIAYMATLIYISQEYSDINYDDLILFLAMFFVIIIALVMLVLLLFVINHNSVNIIDGSVTVFSFIYVGVLLSFITIIRDINIIYAWLPFIIAFGCDTGAYLTGSLIGKHKLCSKLSPKKTIEGAVGGLVFSAVLTGIYLFAAGKLGYTYSGSIIMYILLGIFGGAVSQIGDLAASSIKRFTGIKDYGKIMPGHGGVLDRFDSVIYLTPIVLGFVILFN